MHPSVRRVALCGSTVAPCGSLTGHRVRGGCGHSARPRLQRQGRGYSARAAARAMRQRGSPELRCYGR